MRIYIPLFFLIIISSGSCTVGPDYERKSRLNYLSGEHYESRSRVGPVPLILEGKNVKTVIEGAITVNEYTPLRFTRLLLQKDNQTILETTTSQNGLFEFTDYLPNGNYLIKIDSPTLRWEEEIKVDKYELKNLHFNINTPENSRGQ